MQQALAGETVSYELHNPTAAEIRHVAVTLVPLRLEDGSGAGGIARVRRAPAGGRAPHRRRCLMRYSTKPRPPVEPGRCLSRQIGVAVTAVVPDTAARET